MENYIKCFNGWLYRLKWNESPCSVSYFRVVWMGFISKKNLGTSALWGFLGCFLFFTLTSNITFVLMLLFWKQTEKTIPQRLKFSNCCNICVWSLYVSGRRDGLKKASMRKDASSTCFWACTAQLYVRTNNSHRLHFLCAHRWHLPHFAENEKSDSVALIS